VRGLTYPASAATDLLPLGLAQGCEMVAPVAQGQPIPTDGVVPAGNTIEILRRLQDDLFPTTKEG
jgi:predicted homoserine dehydrogenase-like protein